MNKKIALILACCAATSFAACNETTEWNFTESCDASKNPKRCVESTIQVCEDGVWVPEVTCEGNTPWCDVTTHTCVAKPVAKDCQDGAQKCDQNAVWTCRNGKWEKTTDCNEGDKMCNSTTYVCDPKAQPEVTCDHNDTKLAVGDTVCSNDTTLQTCTLSQDGTTASLTPTDCSTSSKVCGNDADNKAACIDAQQPAPTVKCTREGEETEYEVGDKYCGADNTLYTCTLSADGTTATYQSAQCQGDTPVCDNMANDCRAYNDCTLNNANVAHDAFACDGNVSKKCNDGTLETEDCSTKSPAQVCLATSGKCDVAPATACTDATVGTVENGKTICKDNNVWTCNNTQLSKTTDCTVTEAEAAAHLVSVCTPGEQGANATCVKKCAEDYKFGEGDNANTCVAAHDQQCKINTVGDKQVAQYRKSDSHGIYSEWENCNTAYNSIQNGVYKCDVAGEQCVYDNQCESGYHEVDDLIAGKSCQHDVTNNCKDSNNAPVELDAYICLSDTQVGVCQTGENYTATVVAFGNACDTTKGMVCDSDKVGTLFKCACTNNYVENCQDTTEGAKINRCDVESGKIISEKCPTNNYTKKTTCLQNENKCGGTPVCVDGYVLKGGVCAKCESNDDCVNGKICAATGKCVDRTCTKDICLSGMTNKCSGETKTLGDTTRCIENGVGKCSSGSCTGEILRCDNGFVPTTENEKKVCKAYAEVVCDANICDGEEWYVCGEASGEPATRKYKAPELKPEVDANGTWACNATNGWDLTCKKVDGVEVYEKTESEGKKSCTLKAGMCIADADCAADATKKKCNTTTKTCEAAPAPAPTKSLIISEVVSATGKVLELYNPTDADIDLSKCKIDIYEANGGSSVDKSVVLSGMIAKDHAFVICGETTNDSWKAKCQQNILPSEFSKKRVIALKCNDQFMDVIGKIGGINHLNKNHAVRKCGIVLGDSNPNDDWENSFEEDQIKWNSWDGATLGTHKAVCDVPVE